MYIGRNIGRYQNIKEMSDNTTVDIVAAQMKIISVQNKVIKLYEHYAVAPMVSTYKLIEAANTELAAAKQDLKRKLHKNPKP